MENRRSIAAIRSQVLQQPAVSPTKEGTGKPSFMFFFWKRFVASEPGLQLERERERERELLRWMGVVDNGFFLFLVWIRSVWW